MLLLILSLLALPPSSLNESPVLTNRPKEILAAVSYRIKQSCARVRVGGVLFSYGPVIVEKVREVLSVSTGKLAALELPEFVVHYALFEEVKIDLTHILYRAVGHPRRGRAGKPLDAGS